MKVTLIGLPNSGKTTVFNALTRGRAETSAYASGRLEPNVMMVKVPDPRLEVLAEMYHPKKITYADVQYVDIAGLGGESHKSRGLPPALLNYLATADALLYVVRAFEDVTVPHPSGSLDVARDVAALDLELAFSDLSIIERRLERLETDIQKIAKEREKRIRERELLQRLKTALEAGTLIRDVDLTPDDEWLLRGYQFLTAKPALIVINIGEDQIQCPPQFDYQHRKSDVIAFCGKLEAELAQMEDAEARVFMDDLGIRQPARDRVIAQSYKLLGLISFITIGPEEVRAWPIRQGTSAVDAAGVVHSDMQRGFIRAEVVRFEDLVAAGSLAEARKRGTLKVEGKHYIIQDGDVCHFLFNV